MQPLPQSTLCHFYHPRKKPHTHCQSVPRKGIAGSRCTSRLKLPDCFPNWLHHFTFSPQCKSFSHPHQQPWLSVFLSWSSRGYESVTWCLLNSLRAWVFFRLSIFSCLLSIHVSSMEKCLFKVFAHFNFVPKIVRVLFT
jgi:hypothetical protein